jgi:hypothetical protein
MVDELTGVPECEQKIMAQQIVKRFAPWLPAENSPSTPGPQPFSDESARHWGQHTWQGLPAITEVCGRSDTTSDRSPLRNNRE